MRASAIASNIPMRGCSGIHALRTGGTRQRPGAKTEVENPTLVYETEAFLFQVKSNLDLIIRALACIVPRLKSRRGFKHSGARGTEDYRAGGKIINQLIRSSESTLAEVFESHRQSWIQELTIMRDTITHEQALRNFHCFVEEPYLDGELVSIHYPSMPSGEGLDSYCQTIFASLCDLYAGVFRELQKKGFTKR